MFTGTALAACGLKNPRALRYVIALMALYLHFGDFHGFLLARLDREIARAEEHHEAAAAD